MASQLLEGVHPDLVEKVNKIILACAALELPVVVTAGVRTLEVQQHLFAQGRSLPGKIVTNCDGVNRRSPHQLRSDGYGHAVDLAFLDYTKSFDTPSWAESHPWAMLGAMAKALGLVWGGDFKSLIDRPHVELP